MAEDRASCLLGEKPELCLPHNVYAVDYEIVNLFDWQEEIKGMLILADDKGELDLD